MKLIGLDLSHKRPWQRGLEYHSSFVGVVLYEMVAGRAPFHGETRTHTVVSSLESEPPPLVTFAPDAPAELQRIVRKALTKERDNRYQTARDLMLDLKSLRRDLDIHSEMRRSSSPAREVEYSSGVKDDVRKGNQDLSMPKDERFPTEADSASNEGQRGEESVGLRIAAMVAMFLLALAAILFGYCGRK